MDGRNSALGSRSKEAVEEVSNRVGEVEVFSVTQVLSEDIYPLVRNKMK